MAGGWIFPFLFKVTLERENVMTRMLVYRATTQVTVLQSKRSEQKGNASPGRDHAHQLGLPVKPPLIRGSQLKSRLVALLMMTVSGDQVTCAAQKTKVT